MRSVHHAGHGKSQAVDNVFNTTVSGAKKSDRYLHGEPQYSCQSNTVYQCCAEDPAQQAVGALTLAIALLNNRGSTDSIMATTGGGIAPITRVPARCTPLSANDKSWVANILSSSAKSCGDND